LLALVVISLAGCTKNDLAGPAMKTPEVVISQPITADVVDYQDFTGRLDALKTVEIRARASGYVKEAPFREGDEVHEGDLLFLIDPQTYQADLDQAEANIKLAEAELKLQGESAYRVKRLVGGGTVSKEEFDQTIGAWEKAQASLGAMKAARDRTKLYLGYTRVVAPLSGRISRRFVDPGNLVKADDTMLTTIVTENPLFAYFDVDERTYLNLMGNISSEISVPTAATQVTGPAAGAGAVGLHSPPLGPSPLLATAALIPQQRLPVLMRLANEEEFTRLGFIDFIDNRVVATTGTVRMRGVFENPKKLLKPGLFVRIRLPIGVPYKAVLITDEALMSDQGRKFVYVLNDKDEAIYRLVTLGQDIHGLRVIKEGLAEGERVIVKGTQRVRAKSPVIAKNQDPPEPPQSPLVRVLRQEQAAKSNGSARKS
jgi:RND family efflux transporter MFP subunit